MPTFGLYAAIGDPPRGERLQQCIDEVCAEAQLAEQVGFEAILVGEHHQHRDGFLPSPLIVSTAVAARTRGSASAPAFCCCRCITRCTWPRTRRRWISSRKGG